MLSPARYIVKPCTTKSTSSRSWDQATAKQFSFFDTLKQNTVCICMQHYTPEIFKGNSFSPWHPVSTNSASWQLEVEVDANRDKRGARTQSFETLEFWNGKRKTQQSRHHTNSVSFRFSIIYCIIYCITFSDAQSLNSSLVTQCTMELRQRRGAVATPRGDREDEKSKVRHPEESLHSV